MAVQPFFLRTWPVVSKENLWYAVLFTISEQFVFQTSFLGWRICRTLLLLESCDFRNSGGCGRRNGLDFLQGKRGWLSWVDPKRKALSGTLCLYDELMLHSPITPFFPFTQPCGYGQPQWSGGDILVCRVQLAEHHFSLLSIFPFTFSKDQRSGLFHLQDNKNKAAINVTKHVVILVQ